MKYSSEDIIGKQPKLRYPEQFDEEEEVIDYALLKTYLEMFGYTCKVGNDTLHDAFYSTVRSIHENYFGDEMPYDLRKFVKKVFYINSVCAKQFGKNFVKCCINLDRAEDAGGKEMLKIYVLLDGIENYQEHFDELQKNIPYKFCAESA